MRSKMTLQSQLLPWQQLVLLTLAGWFGASLLLDLLVMPTLYSGGMMTQSGFASTGYALFESFNHVELLLGSVVLTGLMVVVQQQDSTMPNQGETSHWRVLWPALLLFSIPLLYTYGLTPYMSALGLPLTEAAEVPSSMDAMHGLYWGLEMMKVSMISLLLYRMSGIFGLGDRFQGFSGRLTEPE